MKKSSLFVFLCFTFLYSSEIHNYRVLNYSITYKDKNYTILRAFEQERKNYYLAVDESGLKTQILSDKIVNSSIKNSTQKTTYSRLLNQYTKAPYLLQNYGLKHLLSDKIFLTIDMCPSKKKGYEQSFFETLSKYRKKAIPIVVFISGKWIKSHYGEFLSLRKMQSDGLLEITWGNHTLNHFYDAKRKLEENFILTPGINIEDEILENEKLLLSYGITPSILFRFPGLVSDKNSVNILNRLGLIPVASDAWLAKGEEIKNGSIVLVHGNKNEPFGIKKAKDFIEKNSDFIFGSILDNL